MSWPSDLGWPRRQTWQKEGEKLLHPGVCSFAPREFCCHENKSRYLSGWGATRALLLLLPPPRARTHQGGRPHRTNHHHRRQRCPQLRQADMAIQLSLRIVSEINRCFQSPRFGVVCYAAKVTTTQGQERTWSASLCSKPLSLLGSGSSSPGWKRGLGKSCTPFIHAACIWQVLTEWLG